MWLRCLMLMSVWSGAVWADDCLQQAQTLVGHAKQLASLMTQKEAQTATSDNDYHQKTAIFIEQCLQNQPAIQVLAQECPADKDHPLFLLCDVVDAVKQQHTELLMDFVHTIKRANSPCWQLGQSLISLSETLDYPTAESAPQQSERYQQFEQSLLTFIHSCHQDAEVLAKLDDYCHHTPAKDIHDFLCSVPDQAQHHLSALLDFADHYEERKQQEDQKTQQYMASLFHHQSDELDPKVVDQDSYRQEHGLLTVAEFKQCVRDMDVYLSTKEDLAKQAVSIEDQHTALKEEREAIERWQSVYDGLAQWQVHDDGSLARRVEKYNQKLARWQALNLAYKRKENDLNDTIDRLRKHCDQKLSLRIDKERFCLEALAENLMCN